MSEFLVDNPAENVQGNIWSKSSFCFGSKKSNLCLDSRSAHLFLSIEPEKITDLQAIPQKGSIPISTMIVNEKIDKTFKHFAMLRSLQLSQAAEQVQYLQALKKIPEAVTWGLSPIELAEILYVCTSVHPSPL